MYLVSPRTFHCFPNFSAMLKFSFDIFIGSDEGDVNLAINAFCKANQPTEDTELCPGSWITLFPLDSARVPKISKRHFFKDIWNSFLWVIDMGLDPHQKKFFWKISKSTGASLSQSLGTKRGVADIWVVLWPKFFHQFTTDLWLISGEKFIKLSLTVLELLLILLKLTVYLWPPYVHPTYKVDIGWPWLRC